MHKNRTIKLRSSIFPMFILYISIIIAAIITGVSMVDHKEDQTTEIKEIVTTLSEPEEAEVEQELLNLGEFRLTAYCACEKCCGKWALNRPVDENGETIVYTASMKRAESGWTIAADTDILPFGTKIWIDGHEYEVQDRGGAIKGNRIDIYFDTHEEACQFGVQYKDVFVDNSFDIER